MFREFLAQSLNTFLIPADIDARVANRLEGSVVMLAHGLRLQKLAQHGTCVVRIPAVGLDERGERTGRTAARQRRRAAGSVLKLRIGPPAL